MLLCYLQNSLFSVYICKLDTLLHFLCRRIAFCATKVQASSSLVRLPQSYEIKSPPGLGPFGDLKSCGFSLLKIKIAWVLLCIKVQICKQSTVNQCTVVHCLQIWTLIHHSTQAILIFSRVSLFHLERLKKGTWLHSFGLPDSVKS